MHYTNTAGMLHTGIKSVKQLQGNAQRQAFAWLLGYAAHVATDVTIHPVVELKVGPYAANKKAHRVCEMHQDTYIFQRLNLGQIGLSEHLDSGIWGCCEVNTDKLDTTVSQLWGTMLKDTFPAEYSANPPDINKWHQKFKKMVDKIGEEGNHLMPISRHLAIDCGLTYPPVNAIDLQYIKALKTPAGNLDYDEIFNRAKQNVSHIWSLIAQAVFASDEAYLTQVSNWNLDTGKNEAGSFVFWNQLA